MGCLICNHPDRAGINAQLLEKRGRGCGFTRRIAEQLGCHRSVVWRHRKKCLGLATQKGIQEWRGDLTLREKAVALQSEANRLQLCAETGSLGPEAFTRAMRALDARRKLLELEVSLRKAEGKPVEEPVGDDGEELERAKRELAEVSGGND
jgi:hypothetical protein